VATQPEKCKGRRFAVDCQLSVSVLDREEVDVSLGHTPREERDATIAVTGRDEPVVDWVGAYQSLYPRYGELYAALKPTYAARPVAACAVG